MFVLKFLNRLYKILRSNASPSQIAGGFVCGMIMGLTPLFNLHNFIVFLLILVFRVNISMVIAAFVIFSGFAFLLDPLFHSLGYWLLVDMSLFRPIWTDLYNSFFSFSSFNNTIVLGSFLVSMLLTPSYILIKKGVVYYRNHLDDKISNMSLVKSLKATPIYSIYIKIKEF
jgi:uncharacterized protein (TIGR03546 family)